MQLSGASVQVHPASTIASGRESSRETIRDRHRACGRNQCDIRHRQHVDAALALREDAGVRAGDGEVGGHRQSEKYFCAGHCGNRDVAGAVAVYVGDRDAAGVRAG